MFRTGAYCAYLGEVCDSRKLKALVFSIERWKDVGKIFCKILFLDSRERIEFGKSQGEKTGTEIICLNSKSSSKINLK